MNRLRSVITNQAKKWLGKKESNLTHREIIDVYNSHKPLARGYKLKYDDPWCAGFVSAVFIKCGYVDIFATEVSCGKLIELLKKKGIWVESDGYIPNPGDVIFYDWKDNGVGENKDGHDHVGIVLSRTDSVMKVIEGNLNNSVSIREIKVNGRYIRGYGVPKYDSEPSEAVSKPSETIYIVKKGDNLTKIAKIYKTSWQKIYNDNKKVIGNNPNLIKPGQKLVIK